MQACTRQDICGAALLSSIRWSPAPTAPPHLPPYFHLPQKVFGINKINFPRMACTGGATLKQQLASAQAAPASAAVATAGGAQPRAPLTGTYLSNGQREQCQVAHCAVCSPAWSCRVCQTGYRRSTLGTLVRTGRGAGRRALCLPCPDARPGMLWA